MISITTKKLDIEESLKQRLDFICESCESTINDLEDFKNKCLNHNY